MRIPDKLYDILKWVCLVCIPALTSFFCVLDAVFSWGYSDTVAKISAALCTLIGALIGISTAEYRKGEKK